MKNRTIKVDGEKICIPGYFKPYRKAPRELKGLKPQLVQTDNASCILVFDQFKDTVLPTYDLQALIDEMHSKQLNDNQGLIVVEQGDAGGRQYLYTIIKTLGIRGLPVGVQYDLTAYIAAKKGLIQISGNFAEDGMTGVRDSMVLATRSKELGGIEAAFEGWTSDPYDPSYRKGALMNLSEDERFDSMFPDHPLSIARDVVRTILGRA